ncbi:MAG: toll/interleukin-1 receptor domain-containing protein [Candidatus Aminicenantes bacterium]|nr:toll/interleukin-1 receptor domain-containing protein [Candidatus Aminicenantes bacterium]
MSYQYDVFLSYNRKFPHGQWVDEMFYPLFVPYLEDALNQEVSVFKDTEEIKTGAAWPERLQNALTHSRCMVSIFSPAYFRSEWCMKEFSIMYRRQKRLGYMTVKKPSGLIIPVNIFDGEHFPRHASKLQMLDCRNLYRVGEGAKHTTIYIELQGLLQEWVYDVADAVKNAPAWDAAWLEEEWLDIPDAYAGINIKLKVKRPVL